MCVRGCNIQRRLIFFVEAHHLLNLFCVIIFQNCQKEFYRLVVIPISKPVQRRVFDLTYLQKPICQVFRILRNMHVRLRLIKCSRHHKFDVSMPLRMLRVATVDRLFAMSFQAEQVERSLSKLILRVHHKMQNLHLVRLFDDVLEEWRSGSTGDM